MVANTLPHSDNPLQGFNEKIKPFKSDIDYARDQLIEIEKLILQYMNETSLNIDEDA